MALVPTNTPLDDAALEQAIARMRPLHRKWFDHYIQDPRRDATAASIAVGLGKTRSAQSTLGGRLRKRYRQVIEAYDLRIAHSSVISPREVQERLAEIARGALPATRISDRLKALELVARIHGMLSDKIDVDIDSTRLRRELGSMVGAVDFAFSGPSGEKLADPSARALPEAPVDAELASDGEIS